jgi:hypothetical protein
MHIAILPGEGVFNIACTMLLKCSVQAVGNCSHSRRYGIEVFAGLKALWTFCFFVSHAVSCKNC